MKIVPITDPAPLRAWMNHNPDETAYALGDLDPALWAQSAFHGALDADGGLLGFVLFFYGFEVPSLVLHGAQTAAILAALAPLDLPPQVFCLSPSSQLDALTRYYDPAHLYKLHRMTTTPQTFQAPSAVLARGDVLRRLQPADAPHLNALYAQAADPGEAIMAFLPEQIGQGVFYGVERDGALVAAAGTHVASRAENIAAVGNVFTAPAARRAGLGGATTAAVTQALFASGISRVVLNVKQSNTNAIRVYEKLGYTVVMPFIEGPAQRTGTPLV